MTEHVTREREIELLKAAKAGDRKAKGELVKIHTGFIKTVAFRFSRRSMMDEDDIFNEGCLGLLHAIDKYDFNPGHRFITYAANWVRSYVMRAVSVNRSHVTGPLHLSWLMTSRRFNELISKLQDEGVDHEEIARRACAEFSMKNGHGNNTLSVGTMKAAMKHLVAYNHGIYLSDPNRLDHELTLQDSIADQRPTPERLAIASSNRDFIAKRLRRVHMDEREKYILEHCVMGRKTDVKDMSTVGKELGISRERVRQLRNKLLDKIRLVLEGTEVADANLPGGR